MFRNLISSPYPVIRRFLNTLKYGMTIEELEHLRASWKIMSDTPIPVGKLFFKLLFEAHPEYQKLFREYAVPHKGLLVHTKEFTWHIKAVTSTLNRIIMRFEDGESVDRVMDYVAQSHVNRKVGRKEMENMGIAVKETLRILNKAKFTKESEAAFDKFYKGFLDHYTEKLTQKGTKIKPTDVK